MKIIAHRGFWGNRKKQNSIEALHFALQSGFGIEFDVRDRGSKIVIAHDKADSDSALFEDFLDKINRDEDKKKPFAINIKADGLASEIKSLTEKHEINNYFTFDMSIPEMIIYKNADLNYFSRLSEYEKKPILLKAALGVWVDSFVGEWYNEEYIIKLQQRVRQVCLVSSELHGRNYIRQWLLLKKVKNHENLMLCTDKPNEAKEYFK